MDTNEPILRERWGWLEVRCWSEPGRALRLAIGPTLVWNLHPLPFVAIFLFGAVAPLAVELRSEQPDPLSLVVEAACAVLLSIAAIWFASGLIFRVRWRISRGRGECVVALFGRTVERREVDIAQTRVSDDDFVLVGEGGRELSLTAFQLAAASNDPTDTPPRELVRLVRRVALPASKYEEVSP
ncbi:MAG TPA: hypothetical protein VFM93_12405 [Candidatus Limnocylindria bacterium]|nr:hypothetical protein [Candidatus Limnocylindria bacterium]